MTYRNLLQTLCCAGIQLTLIPALVRLCVRRRVTIVNYHDPAPEIFERHIRAFSRRYTFVSLEQVVTAITNGSFADLPRRTMVITLDDGCHGVACLAPVIAKYRVPVTVYVVAGLVNSRRRFWWGVVPSHDKLQQLKEMPDSDRRRLLHEIYGHTDEREYESGAVLSAASLDSLLSCGVTIGSHTVFHPLLPKCTSEVAVRELQESRHILERFTRRTVEHFAYPGGAWDSHTRQLVAACGYTSARTIDAGWVTRHSDPVALPCFGISDDASVMKALVQASGVWAFAKGVTAYHRNGYKIQQ
jgi:peptidoglycan/xylan/chitin deacetylase (PgdA/CDA1 family)